MELAGFFVYTNGETPDRQILELRDVCYIVGITEIGSVEVEKRSNYAGNG